MRQAWVTPSAPTRKRSWRRASASRNPDFRCATAGCDMAPILLGAPGRPPRCRLSRLAGGLLRLQLQRGRIDAVALTGGVWAIVEDVAQVPTAPLADDLGALHEEAVVRTQLDVLEVLGLVAAGPAGAGLELG